MTNSNYWSRALIIALMLLFTWYYLRSVSSVTPVPIKKELSSFNQIIGDYRLSRSIKSSAKEVAMLGVNDYLQYNYLSNNDDIINLYVGYYRAVGVEGKYHSPKTCIPGGGWGIDKVKKVQLNSGIEGKSKSFVSEMLIRKGSDYQVVLYWYQNRGRIIASEYWERIYLVLDALFKGRRDGAFIRIMSLTTTRDIKNTEIKLQRFAENVMPLLENHLPGAQYHEK